MKKFQKSLDIVFNILSGEWIIYLIGNGGLAVFLRSIIVSIEFFSITLLIKSWCETGPGSEFSLVEVRKLVGEYIEWLGAAFAGCYAAFYTRFSSQWSYLANLYNQIMSVKSSLPQNELSVNRSLIHWQVGFIADAYTLHLDRKELYSSVICSMLKQPEIMEEFKKTMEDDAQKIINRVCFSETSEQLTDPKI